MSDNDVVELKTNVHNAELLLLMGRGLTGFLGGWKRVTLRNRLGRVGLTTQTGWDGLGRYGSRSARKSHIIFHRDFGLGWVGALGRRGGSGRVVVRALEIWVGADLGRVQPH